MENCGSKSQGCRDSCVCAHTTVEETVVKMARMIHLPDEKHYHSHTLRMGRTEEQIMIMGNWTSSTAAGTYVCSSEVTMRANGKVTALAEDFSCYLVEISAPSRSAGAIAAAASESVPTAAAGTGTMRNAFVLGPLPLVYSIPNLDLYSSLTLLSAHEQLFVFWQLFIPTSLQHLQGSVLLVCCSSSMLHPSVLHLHLQNDNLFMPCYFFISFSPSFYT